MSGTLRLRGSTSGYSELQAPAVAADQTFVLPTAGGTLLTTDSPVPKLTLELGSASQPSLTFQGDTDTGLFSEGTNTLNLVTGGSSKVVLGAAAHTIYACTGATVRAIDIDSSGRVGIGTSSPGETLHVNGTATAIKIDSNGDAALRFATSGTNKFSIYHTSGGTLNFFDNTNSQNRLRIDSSGNVGIGTTSPAAALDVVSTTEPQVVIANSDSNGANLRFQNSATGSGQTNGLFVGIDAAEKAVIYNYENTDLLFGTNSTERARIDSSGNLTAIAVALMEIIL